MRQDLHAAASDLRFVATGGSCDPRALREHADVLDAHASGTAPAMDFVSRRRALQFRPRVSHQRRGMLAFKCPGCTTVHEVSVSGPRPWGFNGNVDAPTLTPSIHVRGGKHGPDFVCHSYVTDGRIQFLSDCTHGLAGMTVALPSFRSPYVILEDLADPTSGEPNDD